MPPTADQALIIRHWDWSETSQTVSLFGRTLGLFRGLAKGSKREKSNFSGGLEVLTRGEILAIIKPHTELANLTAWDLQETFPAIRKGLNAFYSAMYMADLLQHAVHEHDPHPVLFDSLLVALRALDSAEQNAAAVVAFQWSTLVETGYRPELVNDVVTTTPLPEARTYSFAPRLGGFTITSDSTPLWKVRAETLTLLRALSAAPNITSSLPHLIASSPFDPRSSPTARASRFLAAYFREILGRDLPSAAHLFGELKV